MGRNPLIPAEFNAIGSTNSINYLGLVGTQAVDNTSPVKKYLQERGVSDKLIREITDKDKPTYRPVYKSPIPIKKLHICPVCLIFYGGLVILLCFFCFALSIGRF
jgi:hypothetical protein